MSKDYTSSLKENINDKDMWEEWFRSIYPKVYYFMYKYTGGDKDLSQDCIQSALEKFIRYEGIEKVDSDKKAISYLIMSARNALSSDRRKKHHSRFEEFDEEIHADETIVDEEDFELIIKDAYRKLSSGEQKIMGMLIDGSSTREIAKKLNINYSAAAVRIHRLKTEMKKNTS